ncbi:MAG: aspartyl protease family protein [Acidobacteriota bacterium]
MRQVNVEVFLENSTDRENVRRGLMQEADVRKLTTMAIVDTGAVMMMLPQDQVEELGLRELRKAIVTYADERKEERPIAGAVTVRFGKREAIVECVVGPPGSEVLFGQVPLEVMDLVVDCPQQKLMPRPESPFLPMLSLK